MKKLCTGGEIYSKFRRAKLGLPLFENFTHADGSALERMAMKAAMTMPALLLLGPVSVLTSHASLPGLNAAATTT